MFLFFLGFVPPHAILGVQQLQRRIRTAYRTVLLQYLTGRARAILAKM